MLKLVTQEIEKLIEEKLSSLNIELVDFEYRNENKRKVLRVFIDRDSGADLQLCSEVTYLVKDIIDGCDIFYDYLEVSSPGLDRVLKKDRDFKRFLGQKVKVTTSKLFDGSHTIIGILKSFDNEHIEIETEAGDIAVPRSMTKVVRLHPDL